MASVLKGPTTPPFPFGAAWRDREKEAAEKKRLSQRHTQHSQFEAASLAGPREDRGRFLHPLKINWLSHLN